MPPATLRPSAVATLGLASAACCLVAALVLWWSTGRAPDEPVAPDRTVSEPTEVLRQWDRDRAQAWASGDLQQLGGLYAPRSAVGRRDVAMLRSYVDRGLVVEGLTTQLIEVAELRRSEEVWVLEVTDRVHGGVIVGEGVRRALPNDAPDRRKVTLRRHDDTWRVASVVTMPDAGRRAGSGGQSG
ncbi:hypothetical protein IEQ44_13545 [Nocardioides sp. Y6]|uniref:Nuclear transport factor 2 family protein n=1 Tax=Nocardioides malaquae TaxID=2773426 RepID=A0ABR9RVS8_9ACTN|nr:hypothetical protein [Nocardioides malaquae]MBE7325671.1 hypothetical protein [Nocardioides malaquae]